MSPNTYERDGKQDGFDEGKGKTHVPLKRKFSLRRMYVHTTNSKKIEDFFSN